MPAGCDFICKNEDCIANNSGFTMTAPWPMARIELIIGKLNDSIPAHKSYKEKLIQLKKEGKKYACIVFPNTYNLPWEACRIQVWSPEALCIWDYDVVFEDGQEMTYAINKFEVPEKCPKTGGRLMTFSEATKEGIDCPHCKTKLSQDRWFTNEH